MVTQLHEEVLRATADLTTLQTLMACAILNITNFISALNEAEDIRLVIEGLIYEQLSLIILPPDAIEQTLTQIHSSLPYSLTGLYLEQIPAEYYRMHNFVAARQGNNLLLALRFPLSGIPIAYTLYEFQTFPIPVSGSGHDNHVTMIQDLPYGIAFDTITRGKYCLLFPSKPDFVDSDFFYVLQPSKSIRSFFHQNICASALLINDRQSILQLCKFQLRPESLVFSIIPLSRSEILVTNVSSLEYICDRRHVTTKGCTQRQVTIPCRCHLQRLFILPQRLATCAPHPDNVTQLHTVNLAVLQTFLDDFDLGPILTRTITR